jgi:hypothetical protein
MRSRRRLYLKVFIERGHHSLVIRRCHGRRRSHDIQVLDLGIDSLLVARALLDESAPLAPGRAPDCQALFAGRYRCCYPVLRDPHFQIERGRKEMRILTYTMPETDCAGAGEGDFTPRRLLIKDMPLLVDGECLLDRHPRVDMIEQNEGPVLDQMLSQHNPQYRNREVAAWIQLLEEPLPGHQHLLQIHKIERQWITCTVTVLVIRYDLEI